MLEEIKKMPKVELHLHLDGSVSLELASKLSGLSLEVVQSKMIAKDKCADLNEYLTKFDFPISLMQTKENLKIIAEDLATNLYRQNVIYAEIRFAPSFHTEKGLSYDEVVESVLEGIRNVPIKVNLILCLMRGISDESNLRTIETAKKYLGRGVGGIDLAGAESIYPTSNYKNLFELVSDYDIPFTVHAGEADGPKSIERALYFGAKRIGHGIRCLEDNKLVQRLIKDKILLEVCPTSNVQTNVVSSYKEHPIFTLYEKQIKVCINTDNVTVSNVSLTDEYIKLVSNFDFTLEDLKAMNINALNRAFISDGDKTLLLKKLS